ncbi:MAG: hypothetical protein ABIB43_03430 [archaeon]
MINLINLTIVNYKVITIFTAHLNGTYHLALIALGGLVALLFLGAGPLSLDKLLFKKK